MLAHRDLVAAGQLFNMYWQTGVQLVTMALVKGRHGYRSLVDNTHAGANDLYGYFFIVERLIDNR